MKITNPYISKRVLEIVYIFFKFFRDNLFCFFRIKFSVVPRERDWVFIRALISELKSTLCTLLYFLYCLMWQRRSQSSWSGDWYELKPNPETNHKQTD